MTHSPAAVSARLSNLNPPVGTPLVLNAAVVLGGSFADLMAARVLSGHSVTVERKTDL
ncbi:MAG TPA: hypothetical protein VFB06_12040 [Streptosporangiaceae bacterium]|nr:hypothetical protein [Streptosporangiaceae bacterium]